jgi:23S rRNA (adenine2030-N6)-methyltransferase
VLSYQHAYHAGNAADLHKHGVLAGLLVRLTRKPRPITYVETHAGRGLYDLASPEARKTGEAAQGVGRCNPDPATPLGRALAATRAAHGPAAYPGSPLIARLMLRPGDRIHLMELHPAEHAALHAALAGPGVAIHRRNGFEGVLAIAPPRPRRGLVLVDPSYEIKSDYAATAAFARALIAKWPEAIVLIWYPILPAGRHETLRAGLGALPHLVDEVSFAPPPSRGMTGSGVALVNPPHGAEEVFAEVHAQSQPILVPTSRDRLRAPRDPARPPR